MLWAVMLLNLSYALNLLILLKAPAFWRKAVDKSPLGAKDRPKIIPVSMFKVKVSGRVNQGKLR